MTQGSLAWEYSQYETKPLASSFLGFLRIHSSP